MDEKVRRTRSQRLKRLYGITIEEYEERLARQDGCCAICQTPPKAVSLSVDHDHKARYLTLAVEDHVVGFEARIQRNQVPPQSPYYPLSAFGVSKNEAKARLREKIKKASCRGLLCHSCNTGLRKYKDAPSILRRAAQYLRDHQGSGSCSKKS